MTIETFPNIMHNILQVTNKLVITNKLSRHVSKLPSFRSLSRYQKNDQIYLHDLDSNKWKVSLSPNENSLPIGYSKSIDKIEPEIFDPNPAFLQLLHKQIEGHIQDDFSFIIEAGANSNSFMPIYDFREIPRYGRIPEIDNIFGYVQVNENGKIVPGTYELNNMYRLCNGVGPIKLSDFLYENLRAKCEEESG